MHNSGLSLIVIVIGIFMIMPRRDNMQVSSSRSDNPTKTHAKNSERSLQMEKVPPRYRQLAAASARGKVERLTYQGTYENKAYAKDAFVYLPAGYSKNPTKRYDIVYLMHGWSMHSDDFLGGVGTTQKSPFKRMLDHAIAEKRIKPLIVVTPTYYPDRSFVPNSWDGDAPLNLRFATHELPNDLVPAVEQRYRTYATSTHLKELRATRNHRAFAGFSMGAITTWYVFEHELNLFKYFMPMAGDSWTVEENGGLTAPAKTANKLAAQVARTDYKANDYMISASVGSDDGTSGQMSPLIAELRKHSQQFTDRNLLYRTDQGGGHDLDSCVNQAYNSLPLFFSKS